MFDFEKIKLASSLHVHVLHVHVLHDSGAFKTCCSHRNSRPLSIVFMLSSNPIFVAFAFGTIICISMPTDLLYEDFYPVDNTDGTIPDESSLFSLKTNDIASNPSQTIGSEDVPLLTSNDQAPLLFDDQLLASNDLNLALEPSSCNLRKRDGSACSVNSAPQGRLELPDLLQIETVPIKTDPLLAPITIELHDNSISKCVDPMYPINLCCNGPLGVIASLGPLVVYETIGQCRPGQ